ncbi:MAG: DUF4340 domain-containing protein [Lachnospiraceae bacterium]|nr:DUF4340 domain-containing protein [Lachnospiraceae bacterium]
MKRQPLQLAVLAAAVVILVAAFIGIQYYNDAQEEKAGTDDYQIIVDIDRDDIIKFSYEYDGETYAFEKTDDTWYYVDDTSMNINVNIVETMLQKLAQLKVVQSIENVTDMSQYGLDEGYLTFEYETGDSSYVLHIGSRNSVTGVYYMAMPSETTVYMIEYYSLLGSFERTPEDMQVTE